MQDMALVILAPITEVEQMSLWKMLDLMEESKIRNSN